MLENSSKVVCFNYEDEWAYVMKVLQMASIYLYSAW